MTLILILGGALCIVMLLLLVQVGVLVVNLLFLHGGGAARSAVRSAVLLTIGTILAAVLGLIEMPSGLLVG